jgi:uncharacterized protein (DUF2237 family)
MPLNVLGTDLRACCTDPMTGYTRDGTCNLHPEDMGQHTVCAFLTDEFLAYSKKRGNDLTTPRPQFAFPGLKGGDKWCLCLSRWIEAMQDGMAPSIDLEATHISVLQHVDLNTLKRFAARRDPNEDYSVN